MTGRAREPAPNTGKTEGQLLLERLHAEASASRARIADLNLKVRAAALDAPADYSRLADELAGAEREAQRLSHAIAEGEHRVELEFARLRAEAERKRINEAIKALATRDAIGAEVQATIKTLAEQYAKLIKQTQRCHDLASSVDLDLSNRFGAMLYPSEITDALGKEFWRASAPDGSDYTGGALQTAPQMLPGADPLRRMDGTPTPYTPSTAPTLSARLAEASAFIGSILRGERTFRGAPAEASTSERFHPGRDENLRAGDEARSHGAETFVAHEARQAHEQRQAAFAAGEIPKPGEDEPSFLRRLMARPATKISAAEREDLNRPKGKRISAAEVMASLPKRPTEIYDPSGLLNRPDDGGGEW